jgi:hypothetical protein
MDNITTTMTAHIAQASGQRPSAFGMPACGRFAEWTSVDRVKADMGLVQGYFPGNHAWRPPIS